LFSVIIATAINGYGGTPSGEYIWDVLKVFLPQLWLCIASVCVINFFVFVFRKSGAVIGITIGFMLAPSTIFLILTIINEWFANLFKYELPSMINSMYRINDMSTGDIARTLAVGAAYMAITVAAGYAIFKKAEIK
jgi:hypothetical protein